METMIGTMLLGRGSRTRLAAYVALNSLARRGRLPAPNVVVAAFPTRPTSLRLVSSSSSKSLSSKDENKTPASASASIHSNITNSSSSSIPSQTSTGVFRWNRMLRRFRRGVGDAMIALGFGVSSASSFKLKQLKQVETSMLAMKDFLEKSGIYAEISGVLASSNNLLTNIVILSRLQKELLQDKDPRVQVSSPEKLEFSLQSYQEALLAVKCAVAAYGDSAIQAARMDVSGESDTRMFGAEDEMSRTRVSEHINIPVSDIVLMDVAYNGSDQHLRHFVAVDHGNKKIILSIRGTFNLSELVVDVIAFTRPFCGGQAHSEMANMAEKVWEASSSVILKLLQENEAYDFVITGHSLGAGTAALLNIMCHEKNGHLVRGRKVQCFTFASPPVFAPLEVVPEAVQSCTNFIHGVDAVPFLSVDSVRHTMNSLSRIEEKLVGLNWISRMRLSMGFVALGSKLLQEVETESHKRLAPKPGAPMLFIPAAHNLWMRESEDWYDAKDCDSNLLASFGVQMDRNMLFDHFPQRYEHALHLLTERAGTDSTH